MMYAWTSEVINFGRVLVTKTTKAHSSAISFVATSTVQEMMHAFDSGRLEG